MLRRSRRGSRCWMSLRRQPAGGWRGSKSSRSSKRPRSRRRSSARPRPPPRPPPQRPRPAGRGAGAGGGAAAPAAPPRARRSARRRCARSRRGGGAGGGGGAGRPAGRDVFPPLAAQGGDRSALGRIEAGVLDGLLVALDGELVAPHGGARGGEGKREG